MGKDEATMTLWVFGDNEYTWAQPLASSLNTDINSLALKGTALEFTYQRFNIARKKIKENDVVVVGLTDFNRRWFFKAYPEAAESDRSPTDNKKENKAIDLFRKHLDHKEIHQTYLIDFLYNLHYLTEELKLRTIVVSEFKEVEKFLESKKELFPLIHVTNSFDNLTRFLQ